MPDINTVVVTPQVSTVAVNSAVPGSYDSVPRLSLGWVSVQEYGAVGDGSTDDATSIQNAITAAVAFGGTVVFPKTSSYYKVSSALNVTGACTLLGPGEIRTASSSIKVFNITGSDVTVDGLRILGPSTAASAQSTGHGICVTGTSAASPATNIQIRNCYVSGFSLYGIKLEWVEEFRVENCTVTEIVNAGVMGLSVLRGLVRGNLIDTVGSTTSTYGIAFSRRSTDSITTEPLSADIVCASNIVRNVVYWEGLDTHAGTRITFADNLVTGCLIGIGVGPSDNASSVATWAPTDVGVQGNTVASGRTDGTASYGLNFAGVSAAVFATGSVVGNTFRGHGTDVNALTGACVRFNKTKFVRCCLNVLYEPSPIGINWTSDNYEFLCQGNTVVDAWSELLTVPAALGVPSDRNTGVFDRNRLASGTKTATYLNVNGLRIDGSTGMSLTLGANDFSAATTNPFTNPGASELLGPFSTRRTSVGDADVTLTVGLNSETQCYATTLTSNRTVTLSTTDAYDGARFRVVRTGLGSFTLDVGGLKTIPSATAAFVEVVYRAGAWQLAGYGTL